jgi:hypothetical protein
MLSHLKKKNWVKMHTSRHDHLVERMILEIRKSGQWLATERALIAMVQGTV